jgi:phosphonate transport system substrate-binding protein
MTFRMTVSPDFSPDFIAGWYIFNTWLQNQLGEAIHLELFDSFEEQRKEIQEDKIDLIFANPYDASTLIRDKGFVAVAAPAGKADEAMICVQSDSSVQAVEDLKQGCNIAMADDPEVNTIGMIMLEPADLNAKNINLSELANYVMVAKSLLNQSADAGFFLKEAYENMSKFLQSQIRPIITSEISVITHSFLVGPKLASRVDDIRKLLNEMHALDKEPGVLSSLGFSQWKNQDQEDAEFMIDLMDTLVV